MTLSRKDSCREALKRGILLMDLAPGAELDETRLAAEHGLSRTPLREIFQTLAGEGYLRLELNRGARVAPLDVGSFRNLIQTAPLIYASLARLAAAQADPAAQDRLRQRHAHLLDAVQAEDAAAAAIQHHAFLNALGEAANNPYLRPALKRLLIDHTRFGLSFFSVTGKKARKQVKKSVQRNEALIEAISAGDAEQAVALVLQAWEVSQRHIEASLKAAPLPIDPTNVIAAEPTVP